MPHLRILGARGGDDQQERPSRNSSTAGLVVVLRPQRCEGLLVRGHAAVIEGGARDRLAAEPPLDGLHVRTFVCSDDACPVEGFGLQRAQPLRLLVQTRLALANEAQRGWLLLENLRVFAAVQSLPPLRDPHLHAGLDSTPGANPQPALTPESKDVRLKHYLRDGGS